MIKRHDLDEQLPGRLDQMLLSGEKITARTVASKLGIPASTITRDVNRTRLIDRYQIRQKQLVAIQQQTDPLSRTRLVQRLALRDAENALLKRYVQLLTAANKAMFIAVAEMGGTAALQRFFKDYASIRAELSRLDESLSSSIRETTDTQPILSFEPDEEDA